MIFFFKKKPVEIVAFVPPIFASLAVNSPIVPASKDLPDWWKKVSPSEFDWSSFRSKLKVKNCPGIISALTTGFILPFWTEMALEWNNQGIRADFADRLTGLTENPNQETDNLFLNDHVFLKIESPWLIKTPVPLLYQSPFYHIANEGWYKQPYGIVTPINNYVATNVFIILKKQQEKVQKLLNYLTPLWHIMPLTDRPVELKVEVYNKDDYDKISSILHSGAAFIRKGLKLRAKANKENL